MANSLWVALHILWKAVSTSFPMTNSLWVTFIPHFVKGGLLTSVPFTNSKWVALQIIWPDTYSSMFDISLHPICAYQKVSCCHAFSMSLFYMIINIDCKISFQLTRYLMLSFLSLISLSLISRWVVLLLHEVSLSHNQSGLLSMFEDRQHCFAVKVFVLSFWVIPNWCHYNKPIDCQVLICKFLFFIYWIYA